MAKGPESLRREPFTAELESIKSDAVAFLTDILALYQKKDAANRGSLLGSIWASVKELNQSIPVEDGLHHLIGSIKATPAWSIEIKTAIEDLAVAKRVVRDAPSTPKDLSRVYRRMRETHTRRQARTPLFFGDIADDLVEAIYDVQDRNAHSLIAQLCYARALGVSLFPELPKETITEEELRRAGKPLRKEKLPGKLRRLRMLKDDLEVLMTSKVVYEYHNRGYDESGKIMYGDWRVPRTAVGRLLDPGGSKTAAYFDIPAIRMLRSIEKDLKDDPEFKEIRQKHPEAYLLFNRAILRIGDEAWKLAARKVLFYKDNAASIDGLPPVEWSEIRLAREAPPGAQKVFFEDNNGPLLVTVDPAPGNAYVATVSICNDRDFKAYEEKSGSAEAAKDLVSPLRKPFGYDAYLTGSKFSFYVRKSDGELCIYGDSNSMARATLGEQYDRCKHLIHFVLQNLMGATYGTAEKSQEGAQEAVPQLLPSEPIIPNAPVVRQVPAQNGESEKGTAVQERRAHTRLLPQGWSMSYYAWENARMSGVLDLYAVIDERENGAGFREEKMDLGSDFRQFQMKRDELRSKYGEKVRFQTYVSRVGMTEEEDELDTE